MNELTTIIIPTMNHEKSILKTLSNIKEYMNKHPSVRQVIITDNASRDETIPGMMHWLYTNKDDRFIFITQPRKISDKKLLLIALESVQTPISIIIEPEGYTRKNQMKKQAELLRKCDLVMPSRFHKDSKTNYKGKKKTITSFTGEKYDDIENINKAFRTKKLLPLIKKTKSEKHYWEEIIMKKHKIRISRCSAHWVRT